MQLLPITPQLAQSAGVQQNALLREVCETSLELQPPSGTLLWGGYLAWHNGSFVGTCAYKTPPRDESVEIAYFTFPGFEGLGIATRMARELMDIARRQGVKLLRAQTLQQQNASVAILRKLGFTLQGEVAHPDDGAVWEWQYRFAPAE